MQSLNSFRKPDTFKTLGIEIECLVPYRYDVSVLNLHHGFFYATDDGSIRTSWRNDEQGVEFVSQPLPSNWLKKEIAKLGKKFTWTHNDSCGIHIHVSRKWLSLERARLIHQFYCGLTDEDRLYLFGRRPNQYCRPTTFGDTRYCAVNSENAKTFEFRMFSSGDGRWAQYCVDMAVYLITNAKQLNLDAALAFRDQYKF